MQITIYDYEMVEIKRLDDGYVRVLVKNGTKQRLQIDTLSTDIRFIVENTPKAYEA